ncbi:hypothetical protein LCGC14_2679650, partial [marine sediment metagenome]
VAGLSASVAEAKRELERQQELLASGDAPRSAQERALCRVDELSAQFKSAEHALTSQQLNLKVLEYQLAAADAEIAQAKDRLSYTTIGAPIDGVITRINAEVGELVVTGTMNNPGTVIMEVADLSRMLVLAMVDEADIGGLEPGQRAEVFMRAYPDDEFAGTVDSISLIGLGQGSTAREFRVEILLDRSKQRIYLGLNADVEIETRRHEGILKVPSQAVLGRKTDELPTKIRENDPLVDAKKTYATVVYRYVKGKAVVTPVDVGASDATHTVIRSGLAEADRVIVGSYKVLEKLKHDQKVKDEKEKPTTQPADTQPTTTQAP